MKKNSLTIAKAIENLDGVASAMKIIKIELKKKGRLECCNSLEVLLKIIEKYKELSPVKKMSKNSRLSSNEVLIWWVNKYIQGYSKSKEPCSVKISKNKRDPAIEWILSCPEYKRAFALDDKKNEKVLNNIYESYNKIKGAQNIVGCLLEGFIAKHLKGWHCAWNATVKGVDFVLIDRRSVEVLQIKNSQATENSSSAAARKNLNIKKWFRFNTKNGSTNWTKLFNDPKVDENKWEARFHKYVKQRIQFK